MSKNCSILLAFALVASVFTPAAAVGQATKSLQSEMTAEEFQATGVSKLSTEQLARLNTWLQSRWCSSAAGPGAEEFRASDIYFIPNPSNPPAYPCSGALVSAGGVIAWSPTGSACGGYDEVSLRWSSISHLSIRRPLDELDNAFISLETPAGQNFFFMGKAIALMKLRSLAAQHRVNVSCTYQNQPCPSNGPF